MCAEASTVLKAVAADFFFNCWCLEIPSDNRIRHITKVPPLSCFAQWQYRNQWGLSEVRLLLFLLLLHGLSPRANYTDRACRRSDCQLLWIMGATWSAWYPYGRTLGFSGQEPLLFYQVAPQLYSRGWVDPVPDPLFFLVVPGIEPEPQDL
jgi:hypothetical protein